MRARARTWRVGPRPTRDLVLLEHDRDLLDEEVVAEAEAHARKLTGGDPVYSLPQVKPVVSAGYIRQLIKVVERLRALKSVRRHRELMGELASALGENEEQRRELRRLWIVESRYKALCEQRELPIGREGA
ncbi:MAG: hypothetical protein IMZ69_11930 [Spirochaetes bacterium]|nr:hypothetical protein [Spirochaetota bacterium]